MKPWAQEDVRQVRSAASGGGVETNATKLDARRSSPAAPPRSIPPIHACAVALPNPLINFQPIIDQDFNASSMRHGGARASRNCLDAAAAYVPGEPLGSGAAADRELVAGDARRRHLAHAANAELIVFDTVVRDNGGCGVTLCADIGSPCSTRGRSLPVRRTFRRRKPSWTMERQRIGRHYGGPTWELRRWRARWSAK